MSARLHIQDRSTNACTAQNHAFTYTTY